MSPDAIIAPISITAQAGGVTSIALAGLEIGSHPTWTVVSTAAPNQFHHVGGAAGHDLEREMRQ